MKYLRKFDSHTDYAAVESGFTLPNVSLCEQEDEVHYKPIPGPDNRHKYVDLGLPSGTLWATMNVGATSVTDYGDYYKLGMGSKTYVNDGLVYTGNENPIALSADTAAQVWGGVWYTPTETQMRELTANTTYQWVTNYKGSGVNGGLFTAQNGNSIFLPAAGIWSFGEYEYEGDSGYYWSSSPKGNGNDAVFMEVSSYGGGVSDNIRELGYSIRPVAEPVGPVMNFEEK